MDEDLTASHWDDLLPATNSELGASNIGLIFNSLNLDDPHRDPDQDSEENGDDNLDTQSHRGENIYENETDSQRADQGLFSGPYGSQQSPFQVSKQSNESELEELSALKKQERESHKSSLLMELTNGVEDSTSSITAASPTRISASESLFEDKGSPIKNQPMDKLMADSSTKAALANVVASPSKTSQFKGSQFKAVRGRKFGPKTVAKHLRSSEGLDPLSSVATRPSSNNQTVAVLEDKPEELLQAIDRPLYELPNSSNSGPAQVEPLSGSSLLNTTKKPASVHPFSNDLEISLGEPVKVGDITTAHIVYNIKTQNKNPQSTFFPQVGHPFLVSRRYKDFRWVYHQLQNNHPGKIIPPPPSKQTYIGRFNENFIENRRMSLEKMLCKISNIPSLADDSDFVLFLTSQDFVNDAKERDQASGSGAFIQASNGDDESDKSGTSIVTGTGAGSFMSSLFSMTVKYPEPDDFFSKKKGYIEDLEHNLKTFYKSLELIATQRVEIASVIGEIADIIEELALLEILKTTTNLLSAFSEVHSKLKENLDRVNLQDQLTLGFTIEEYLRIINAVKYTFETRSKIYQLYQSFKQDLMKKEDSLDRLNSRYKSSIEKTNQVKFEVDKLKQKVSHYENSFNTISDTIKAELDNFEMEKIKDFRNSVEIFIESSIESQKEAIELWETFYERQNLALV